MSRLGSADGVDYLLDRLQQELEPLEHMRVFSTLQRFFISCRRNRGEGFVAYDHLRSQMQKLEEIGAGLIGIIKSWWYLERASLGPDYGSRSSRRLEPASSIMKSSVRH